MRFKVVHVGKIRAPFVRSGIEHYRRKLKPYASLELQALPEMPAGGTACLRGRSRREQERLRDRMRAYPHDVWIVVDEKGKRLHSQAFASLLEQWMLHGTSRFDFLVGGPWGLPSPICDEADLAISLSSFTFSHELALLVLIEQIYRATTIMNHLPYPK